MSTIQLSPAIRVRPDTPISRCVALMNELRIGAVLVSADGKDGLPLGIFTERDLLRNIDLIRSGGYWDYPVSSVMTRPVITVDSQFLERAADLMLEHGFRHLPVVESDLGGEKRLCGVISIRSILRSRHSTPKLDPDRVRSRIALAVQSNDPKFEPSFGRILCKLIKDVDFVATSGSAQDAPVPTLAVVDADGLAPSEVADRVRGQLFAPQTIGLLVVYSPGALLPTALKALENLRAGGKLELFPKPLNLLTLSDTLGRLHIGASKQTQ